ncbi:hypothetical protein JCM33374_g1222 [Metschnikowia sp. JCM 33374]|nr:hypothetical protein JCM33374_g1222 [Metschnikowia sp. JCM 33374]
MYSTRPLFRRSVSTIPCLLNGQGVISNTTLPVFSHNSEIVHHYSPLDNPLERIDQICEDSFVGFQKWSSVPSNDRRDILLATASIIEKNTQLYVDAHRAIGGPEVFARFCAEGAIASCREYASQITRPNGLCVQSKTSDLAFTHQTPMGPVLAIAAWNAPTILWARAIMAPLAAGCSVVIKSSEKAPLPPYLLTQHLIQAGVDPRALQLVQVGAEENKAVVEKFLQNRRIKKVNFTGSTAVGRQIAATAAQNLKPALLELGGKNVSVICKNADLEKAASTSIMSAWFHKGQVCMCLDSVYVDEEVYEEFLANLKISASQMISDPDFKLNQRDAIGADNIHQLVADALKKGAKVIFGGSTSEGPSNCSPVILADVTDDMILAKEESFGPVFSVSKFKSVDDVVEYLNDQPHGLKASVWNSDIVEAIGIAKRLDFGGVHINESTIKDEPTIPHGGVKESGSGRFNSIWGLEEFRYTKAITVSK